MVTDTEFVDAERRMKRDAIARRQQLQEENQGDISQSLSAIRQDPGGIQTRYSSTFRSFNQADPLLEGEEEKLTTLAPFVNSAVDTESPKQASDNTT